MELQLGGSLSLPLLKFRSAQFQQDNVSPEKSLFAAAWLPQNKPAE